MRLGATNGLTPCYIRMQRSSALEGGIEEHVAAECPRRDIAS